ncbi:MAG: hypothetical protein V3U56_15730, partial [Syntrophobacteria bacterium]
RAHKTMILLILLGRCEHCQMKIVSGWLSAVNDLLYKLGPEHGAWGIGKATRRRGETETRRYSAGSKRREGRE